jgi:fumarylacetoacetase
MPLLKSWVTGANRSDGPFPLNNLPCGVFSVGDSAPRCGMAIGDFVLDVAALEGEGLIALGDTLLDAPYWNDLMEAGPAVWADLRRQVTALLKEGASKRFLVDDHLILRSSVTLHLPFVVAEFTDFFSGRHHAANVGALSRAGESPLAANWMHMPLGYNGRASSVVVSGAPVRRPWGHIRSADGMPIFAPSRRFDMELELGAVVGTASDGPVTVAEADAMIFGYVLLNDWSARDIQAWESRPLGPFQAKASATSISPWIVMAAALQPFRTTGQPRDRELLPHLQEPGPMLYDIALEVALSPAGGAETVIARTTSRELTYSAAQQLAQHTTSGCPMSVGDLLGSGTISGPERPTSGSLLELSWDGKEPIAIAGGVRSFLQDHDTLTLRGHARGDGYLIGFGDCTGQVIPALSNPYAR